MNWAKRLEAFSGSVWDDDDGKTPSQPVKKKLIVERFKPPTPAPPIVEKAAPTKATNSQSKANQKKQKPWEDAPEQTFTEEEMLKWKSEKARRAKVNEMSRNVEQRKRIMASALSNLVRSLVTLFVVYFFSCIRFIFYLHHFLRPFEFFIQTFQVYQSLIFLISFFQRMLTPSGRTNALFSTRMVHLIYQAFLSQKFLRKRLKRLRKRTRLPKHPSRRVRFGRICLVMMRRKRTTIICLLEKSFWLTVVKRLVMLKTLLKFLFFRFFF